MRDTLSSIPGKVQSFFQKLTAESSVEYTESQYLLDRAKTEKQRMFMEVSLQAFSLALLLSLVSGMSGKKNNKAD